MEPLVASISKSALLSNVAAIRQRAGRAAICAMVKADAYGHGSDLIAPVLAEAGVEFLAVARVEEATRLRQIRLGQPILLCEPVAAPGRDSYLQDRLETICRTEGVRPTLADIDGAEALDALAGRLAIRVPAHLKIDTGMGRGGALPCDAETICRIVQGSRNLELEGIYTHLADADETDDTFAREQLACLRRLLGQWFSGRHIATPRLIHAANSAGLARFAATWMTLVRPGISLYGYQPNGPADWALSLWPVMRLTARLMMVKDLPAGHAVGYGCTWRASRPSRIGLVPIGYGDGYSRRFGNCATMQLAGRDVPVVGRVSMDLTTIDLTDLPDGGRSVRPGAEVTVISERSRAANSVESLARCAGTIPYEITCLLGRRIRRELVEKF